jgi:hypothetical protein
MSSNSRNSKSPMVTPIIIFLTARLR